MVLSKSSSLIGSGRSAKVFRDDFYTIKKLHVRRAFVAQFSLYAVASDIGSADIDIDIGSADIDIDDVDVDGAGVGIL